MNARIAPEEWVSWPENHRKKLIRAYLHGRLKERCRDAFCSTPEVNPYGDRVLSDQMLTGFADAASERRRLA